MGFTSPVSALGFAFDFLAAAFVEVEGSSAFSSASSWNSFQFRFFDPGYIS
jgi:hypothetical protein